MELNKIGDEIPLADIFINIKEFVRYLLKKWWLILLASCLGMGIGIAYYKMQKPKYVAITTFILEEKTSGGGLSGLASQFGIDISSMGGGSTMFAGDNILDILQSKKIIQKVLLTPVNSADLGSPTLADLYLDFSGMKRNWLKKSMLASVNFWQLKEPNTPIQDSVLNIIYKTVIKKNLVADRINKKGTIVSVQVTALNEDFARLMSKRLVDEASKLYLTVKTGTAQLNIDRMQRRSDSLLALLNNKTYTAAATQLLDVNPGLKTAAVPVELALRDKTVIATLYTEVTKNLEASKLILSQQMPVIQVLDKPGLSLEDNKKGLLFFLVVSIILAVFLTVSCLGVGYFLKRIIVVRQ